MFLSASSDHTDIKYFGTKQKQHVLVSRRDAASRRASLATRVVRHDVLISGSLRGQRATRPVLFWELLGKTITHPETAASRAHLEKSMKVCLLDENRQEEEKKKRKEKSASLRLPEGEDKWRPTERMRLMKAALW